MEVDLGLLGRASPSSLTDGRFRGDTMWQKWAEKSQRGGMGPALGRGEPCGGQRPVAPPHVRGNPSPATHRWGDPGNLR